MKKDWLYLARFVLFGFIFLMSQTATTLPAVSPQSVVFTSRFDSGTFAGDGWNVAVGTQTNKWFVGTTAGDAGGGTTTNAAYISNDAGGATYNYNTAAPSVVHFFRDVTFPAGEGNIQLNFDIKGNAENNFDDVKVFLVPTTTTPTAGTELSGQLATFVNLGTTFVNRNLQLPASSAGTTQRLVFSWRNDDEAGTQPPMAIDNIVLTTLPHTPLSGTKNIPGDYPTLTAAINDLNLNGVGAGGVTFNIAAGTILAEQPPCITAEGTMADQIVFQKSGAGTNPIISTPGTAATTDAGICIQGGDFITFDGVDVTISGGSALEFGYRLVGGISSANGANNNTIKNTGITLNRANTSSLGIVQSNSTFIGGGIVPTAASGANSNNKFYNLTIKNAGSGISLAGRAQFPDLGTEVGVTGSVTANIIGDPATAHDIGNHAGGTSGIFGILASSQVGIKIFNNNIQNVTQNIPGISFFPVVAISLNNTGNGGTAEIYNNKISNVSRITSTSNIGLVDGIAANVLVGDTANVFNNFITGLNFSNPTTATSGLRIRGLAANVNGEGGIVNAFFNSVRIDQGAALNFSSTAFFMAGGTVTTRNNIFSNFTGTQTSTRKHYAYFRSAGTIDASCNNVLHINSGTGAATNGFTGFFTTDRTTLLDWATASGEADSKSSNPQFVSATDLHINPAVGTEVESGGVPVAGITNDIDNDARNATTPDIGADEGAFILTDGTPPVISYTAFGNTSSMANRILSATITDQSGIASGGLAPRIYFRKGTSGAFFSTQCAGTFDCEIDYSLVGGVVAGDQIQYFVVAQDTVGNLGSNPNGASGADVNSITTPPATLNSYRIASPFTGSINVGSGQTITSLTNAGGLFETLNANVLGGDLTVNIVSDLTSETGAVVLNQIAEEGAGAGTFNLIIKPSGAARAISGSSAGGLIPFSGADRVTLDGSLNGGADRSLTITNTNTAITTAVLLIQSGPNGAKNNVVKNVNVRGVSSTTSFIGINFAGNGVNTFGVDNDNNRVENCDIQRVVVGISSGGQSIANKNSGNVFTRNTMTATGTSRVSRTGISVFFEDNVRITHNTISGLDTSEADVDAVGIGLGSVRIDTFADIGAEVTNAIVGNNNIGSVRHTNTASSAGIIVAATESGTNTVANNMISGVTSNATDTDIVAGIFVGTDGGTQQIYHNSVSMTGARGSTVDQYGSYALAIVGEDPTVDIRNNIFFNTQTQTGGSTTGRSYAVGIASFTYTNLISDHNAFFVSGAQATFAITEDLDNDFGTEHANLAALQAATGHDANSQSINPLFVSTTDLHLQATSPLLGDGIATLNINDDFDRELRDNTPDIGADERIQAPRTGTIPAGSYSNANIGSSTLGGSVTIDGTLTLSGIVNADGNTLALACSGSLTGAGATNFVVGSFRKDFCVTGAFSFPLGDTTGANDFTPLEANVTVLTVNPSSLTVSVTDSFLANMPTATSLSRFWTITETGDLRADLTFHYAALDDTHGNTGLYQVFRKEGAAPVTNYCDATATPARTCTPTAASISITNVEQFSDWTAGQLAPTSASVTVAGRVVSSSGQGIFKAVVTMTDQSGTTRVAQTNPFGYYRFDDVGVGQTYFFSVHSKTHLFSPQTQVISVIEEIENLNFTGERSF